MRSPSPPDGSGRAYDVVTVLHDERVRRLSHVAALQRSQLSAQMEAAQAALDDVAHALDRVEDGSYGICQVCRRPIAAARLEARPTATTCVTCAG